MSKNSYGDMLAILEYIDRKKNKPRGKKSPDIDLVTLLRKKKEEAEILEKFLKETKKEEKKEPKGHSFTFTEGLLLAFMAQYFLGPVISAVMKANGLH